MTVILCFFSLVVFYEFQKGITLAMKMCEKKC